MTGIERIGRLNERSGLDTNEQVPAYPPQLASEKEEHSSNAYKHCLEFVEATQNSADMIKVISTKRAEPMHHDEVVNGTDVLIEKI